MNDIKIVNSIEEIKEPNVKYAHISKPTKWIRIDEDGEKEFCVYGLVSGDNPTSITGSNWNMVKVWRTFNGTIRALNNYSKNGAWGMSHWNVK
jgi:hypothetical protein